MVLLETLKSLQFGVGFFFSFVFVLAFPFSLLLDPSICLYFIFCPPYDFRRLSLWLFFLNFSYYPCYFTKCVRVNFSGQPFLPFLGTLLLPLCSSWSLLILPVSAQRPPFPWCLFRLPRLNQTPLPWRTCVDQGLCSHTCEVIDPAFPSSCNSCKGRQWLHCFPFSSSPVAQCWAHAGQPARQRSMLRVGKQSGGRDWVRSVCMDGDAETWTCTEAGSGRVLDLLLLGNPILC